MANIADAGPQRFIGPTESFSTVGLDVSGIALGHRCGCAGGWPSPAPWGSWGSWR